MCYNYSIEKKKVFSFRRESLMTKTDVRRLAAQCEIELKELGYDLPKVYYDLTYNSTKIMGLCGYNKHSDECTIKVSKFHYENNTVEEVRNTIMHELTHAIDRNKHSHNHVWLKLAREVSAQTGTDIKMYAQTTEGEYEASMQRAVAYIDCAKCGQRHFIFRRTKAYKREGAGYYCSLCGPDAGLIFTKLK
jgi:predicted SprT family Zn-dependent metalloprotease